jgi:dGTPase
MLCHAQRLFEGNAQSFRIVTYLEPKEFGEASGGRDRWVGLNLTRATLRSVCKYPVVEGDESIDPDHPKFGVYDDPTDLEYFAWVWDGDQPHRTLATKIMDVSDDIAYATHDFEDGVWSGLIPLHDLISSDKAVVLDLHRKVSERYPEIAPDDVARELNALFGLIVDASGLDEDEMAWAHRPFERTRPSLSYLKRFTAAMIGFFIEQTTPDDMFREPDKDLELKLALLTGIAWIWMIERPDLMTRKFGQMRVIKELFSGYLEEPGMLPRRDELNEIDRAGLAGEEKEQAILRLVRDHIAGMTDHYAIRVHEEMYGGRSPFEIRLTY